MLPSRFLGTILFNIFANLNWLTSNKQVACFIQFIYKGLMLDYDETTVFYFLVKSGARCKIMCQ